MPHDDELAERLRDVLSAVPDITERRMFGGLAFLVGGAMAVAVSGNGGLMVRCDPAVADGLVERDGVARMVMQGRELVDEPVLREYVAAGAEHIAILRIAPRPGAVPGRRRACPSSWPAPGIRPRPAVCGRGGLVVRCATDVDDEPSLRCRVEVGRAAAG